MRSADSETDEVRECLGGCKGSRMGGWSGSPAAKEIMCDLRMQTVPGTRRHATTGGHLKTPMNVWICSMWGSDRWEGTTATWSAPCRSAAAAPPPAAAVRPAVILTQVCLVYKAHLAVVKRPPLRQQQQLVEQAVQARRRLVYGGNDGTAAAGEAPQTLHQLQRRRRVQAAAGWTDLHTLRLELRGTQRPLQLQRRHEVEAGRMASLSLPSRY